jgi:hypothetical protein
MSRIVKVSGGDYRLQVQDGGNIYFDTTGTTSGGSYGTVTILGNLDVKGATTYVESTNTTIKDNVITVNYGLTGATIPSTVFYEGGYEIGRGQEGDAARFMFNEQIKHYDSSTSTEVNGSFVLKTVTSAQAIAGNAGTLSGIQVRSIAGDNSGDLIFDMQGGTKYLAIVNSGGTIGLLGHTISNSAYNYGAANLQPYHIPNVQYLNNYVASTYVAGGGQGIALVYNLQYPLTNNAFVQINATATSQSTFTGYTIGTTLYVTGGVTGTITTGVYISGAGISSGTQITGNLTGVGTSGASTWTINNSQTVASVGSPITILGGIGVINWYSNGTLRAVFNNSGFTQDNVRLNADTITNTSSNNLVLTATNNNVELNAVLNLDDQTWNTPAYTAGKTKLYSSSTIGPGRTGLYITNSTVQVQDELISRKRALLLSILL